MIALSSSHQTFIIELTSGNTCFPSRNGFSIEAEEQGGLTGFNHENHLIMSHTIRHISGFDFTARSAERIITYFCESFEDLNGNPNVYYASVF